METWQDKMKSLEARGGKLKVSPVFKINALRMLMTGKAEEYFGRREADRDPADAAKTYQELLSKVKDYSSRRRKLDSSAKEKMQQGSDPMDVGALGGRTWWEDVGGGYDYEEVYAVGFKSQGKGKGKGKGG